MKKLLLILFLFMSGLTYGQGVTGGGVVTTTQVNFPQSYAPIDSIGLPQYLYLMAFDDSASGYYQFPSRNVGNVTAAGGTNFGGLLTVVTDIVNGDSVAVGTGVSDTHLTGAEYFRSGLYRITAYVYTRSISSGSTDSIKFNIKYADKTGSRTDVVAALNTHVVGNRATGVVYADMDSGVLTWGVSLVGSPAAAHYSYQISVEKLQ